MAFATSWLREKAVFPQFIANNPGNDTGIIVVVPAYNEPQVTTMLDSVYGCSRPKCGTEVIIVINAPPGAPADHLDGNKDSVRNVLDWKIRHPDCFFSLYLIEPSTDIQGWGVGLARKTGMDEALRRFDSIDRHEGVILCLDADCTVEKNYLVEVQNQLLDKKEHNACSIYFEHPVSGNELPEIFYDSVIKYELHLRYYYQGLVYSGFPYAFQTTGSAMAVKALAYMKSGGMNRRQAGEDFYFIQKLVSTGGYFYLNSTAVYPSPRSSYRVPFGTGATMQKLTTGIENAYHTYNFKVFKDLRKFFSMLPVIFETPDNVYDRLPEGLKLFVPEREWFDKISEIKNNTSGFPSFKKRFFAWFNMFKVVKFLNFLHLDHMAKVPVEKAANDLLVDRGYLQKFSGALQMLEFFRTLERRT